MAAKYVTPPGRVSFPNVFTAKARKGSADPKFDITILLPKSDPEVQKFMAEVAAGVTAEIEKKWPNPQSRPAPMAFKKGIKDGDKALFESGVNTGRLKKEKYPEMAGCWIIQASSKNRPAVVDSSGNPILAETDFYPGCWARISFNLFAYQNENVGVGCGLSNVMKVRDDTPFGNSSSAEEDFGGMYSQAPAAASAPAGTAGVQPTSAESMFG